MLTRVEIKNFKSCENLVLDGIGGITALVGRNGAGKTNILQAIDWLARSSADAARIGPEPWFEGNDVAAYFALPDGQWVYRLQAGFQGGAQPSIRETLECMEQNGVSKLVFDRNGGAVVVDGVQEIQISAMSPTMPALRAILPFGASVLGQIRPVYEFLRAIHYYPLDEPARAFGGEVVMDFEYERWLAGDRNSDSSDSSLVYRLIQMKLERPDIFDELASLLGNSGLGLIDSISVDPSGIPPATEAHRAFYFLEFRIGARAEPFRWDQLSLGTRRIIRLLVSLLFDESSVLLIEHPEDGIHRGLLRKLIALLKTNSDTAQVILASHSGTVLSCLTPDEARLVGLDAGKTALRSLSNREIELATHFLEEEGTLEDFLETIQQED